MANLDKSTEKILRRLKKYARKNWGKKCPDFNDFCHVCLIWRSIEDIERVTGDYDNYHLEAELNAENAWIDRKSKEIKDKLDANETPKPTID
jgi:hypothetical protein